MKVEQHGGIAVVHLDDGGGNHFGRDMAEALRKASLKLQDVPPAAVLLDGGANFSKGLAPKTDPLFEPFNQLVQTRDAFRAQEIVQHYHNALSGFARLPCPVVAAIEGDCCGPLLALALSADIRVASLEARFAPTPLSRGVLPGMGELAMLAKRSSVDRILTSVLTGGGWDATEALSLGLVSQLVAPGTASAEAHALLERIMEQPDATRLQAVVTLRGIASEPGNAADLEHQGGARTWIRGEWQR